MEPTHTKRETHCNTMASMSKEKHKKKTAPEIQINDNGKENGAMEAKSCRSSIRMMERSLSFDYISEGMKQKKLKFN